MSNPKVSIIYVDYNTQGLLENSLQSLIRSKPSFRYDVIVVVNGSSNFDAPRVKRLLPKTTIVHAAKNLGFGGGNNLGAEKASGEYLWLLNTDTLVPTGSNMDEVVNWLESHHEYAAATPLLVNAKGQEQSAQVGHFPALWRMILEKPVGLLGRLLPALDSLARGLSPRYVPKSSTDVDQAVAASLVVRKSAFKEVDGFSKEYFFFYEDTDLCRKFSEQGLRVRFVRDAKVVHLLGGSIASQYERKQRYYIAQDIYFLKWKSLVSRVGVKVLRAPLIMWHKVRG